MHRFGVGFPGAGPRGEIGTWEDPPGEGALAGRTFMESKEGREHLEEMGDVLQDGIMNTDHSHPDGELQNRQPWRTSRLAGVALSSQVPCPERAASWELSRRSMQGIILPSLRRSGWSLSAALQETRHPSNIPTSPYAQRVFPRQVHCFLSAQRRPSHAPMLSKFSLLGPVRMC